MLLWLAFLVPWCAFALYAHVALARTLGVVGLVEAAFVSVAALPFWRAACRRPAFQPLAALLRRFHEKQRLRPFEEIREDDARGGPRGLDWRVGFEKRIPDAQAELAAFAAEHARGEEEETRGRSASGRVTLDPDGRSSRGVERAPPPDGDEQTNARAKTKTSGPAFGLASRLASSGFRVFSLCDETLAEPNAAAARHFPATCAAVCAAGGFGARLWVLSPGTNRARLAGFSRGVSDGYWRVHVALDADEADAEDVEEASAARDAAVSAPPSRVATLSACAGIRAGDETRGLEIGRAIVVNDGSFARAWFHDASSRAGVGAAVVLTFDVMRPEYAACRASYVRHKARLVREAGERNAGERTWRSLALAALGNLS